MMKGKIGFILFSGILMFLFSCKPQNFQDSSYCSVGGMVSIETEKYDSSVNWKLKEYYTGIGIGPDQTGMDGNFVYYNIKLDKAGTYYLHYLGNRSRNVDPTENIFEIALLNLKEKALDSIDCMFPKMNAPVWSSISFGEKSPRPALKVVDSGNYIVRIASRKGEGYFLDKILLTIDSLYRPKGMGPEATLCGEEGNSIRDSIILPPSWAFGVLYGGYTDQNTTLEVIDSLINGGFPIDAYWIDSYFWDFNEGAGPKGYIDFVGDTTAFPDVQRLWDQFHERGIKAGIWIWDLIQKDGNELVYQDFLEKDFFSETYINTNGWHNRTKNTITGRIDFNNPVAVEYWKEKLEPFFDRGLDFLKLDNSSSIPFSKAAFEATQTMGAESKGRGFILSHLHTTYDYRHKLYPTKWTGDAKITWSQPDYPNMWEYAMGGLKENIRMVADPSISTYEIPFLSHDAGGYDYFGSTDQSEELYTRWIQFSSMNSIMMFFSTAKNPTRNHPYRYSSEVQDNFRKYTHLRMRLFPYIYSYAIKTHLTGEKMIKGIFGAGYQYLFGDELLVAPVFEEGSRLREINLPEGRWIDPEEIVVYEGNTKIMLEAPLDRLPILVRSGAIIPMRNYSRSIESGSNDTLILEIYPSADLTTFNFYEDDGLSNDYLQGIYAHTAFSVQEDNKVIDFKIGAVNGTFQGMGNHRYYILKFIGVKQPVEKVLINDHPENYSYSLGSGDLMIKKEIHKSEGLSIQILK